VHQKYPITDVCQAVAACGRSVHFQAQLDAMTATTCVIKSADSCGQHLADSVQALAAWAQSQGLAGHVIVRAIDTSAPGQMQPAWARSGLVVGDIPVSTSVSGCSSDSRCDHAS
jgi:hypothetical protein